MKKIIRFAIAIGLLQSSLIIKSQSDSARKSLFRISSISMAFGLNGDRSLPVSQNDYIKMAPANTLVNSNLSSYNNNNGADYTIDFNGYFTVFLGLNHLNKKTNKYYTQREHRIGIRYSSSQSLSSNYSKQDAKHIDTLKAHNPAYNSFVDSIHTQNYNYSVQRSNLYFDFGTIYQTNPQRLFTAYMGYIISLGVSFNNYVSAQYNESYYLTAGTSNVNPNGNMNLYKTETTPIKGGFIGGASIPWGINFRFSKTNHFWSRCALNLEARVGINAETIQNYGTLIKPFSGFHFGVKVLI